MRLICWNARGLGGQRAFKNFKQLVLDKSPDLVFVSEAKLTKFVVFKFRSSLNFHGSFCIEPAGKSGGLALFWNENLDLSILSYSTGHIDCSITSKQLRWYFAGFYGNPKANLRYLSWELLDKISKTHHNIVDSWLVGGDFNEIRYDNEKLGGNIRSFSAMNAFNMSLQQHDLHDVSTSGPKYTWNNMRSGDCNIMARLDRFAANSSWLSSFPDTKSVNLDYYGSDHRSILIKLDLDIKQRASSKPASFQFEHKWIFEEVYNVMVSNIWKNSNHFNGLDNRLKDMANVLSRWSKVSLGSLDRQIKTTSVVLNNLLNAEDSNVDLPIIKTVQCKLEKLLCQEETHWKQRSRVTWLNSGDRNTAFFHKTASDRKKRNSIKVLFNEVGIPLTEQKDIEKTIEEYYQSLFNSQKPSPDDIDEITKYIQPSVTEAMNDFLSKPFTGEEVRKALSDLNPNKTPGPDGFTALFFQNSWKTMGEDVTRECLQILNGSKSLKGHNPTNVTLIPKIKDPTTLRDFRSISLCNVSYKIVARAITNRFRTVLGTLIDPNQSAFIPGT